MDLCGVCQAGKDCGEEVCLCVLVEQLRTVRSGSGGVEEAGGLHAPAVLALARELCVCNNVPLHNSAPPSTQLLLLFAPNAASHTKERVCVCICHLTSLRALCVRCVVWGQQQSVGLASERAGARSSVVLGQQLRAGVDTPHRRPGTRSRNQPRSRVAVHQSRHRPHPAC